ncbi:VOC family protein [Reinekea sp.]|jgi:catechol 2,3-dioxygenase-like lactoylglutathione lyase family enzyme|uniref:VOC family protein n=1 Tax=Reinekea sp. TaxID=1970455 RepID=UPI00398A4147
MELGAFSISLSVSNIEESKVFYQKIGFEVVAGDQAQNWLVLQNGDHKIGLFQGMFEGNMMTFNPGWDQNRDTPEKFADVRELLSAFEAQDVNIVQKSITNESGPSHFTIKDPDGNLILIDQHV